MVTIEQSAMPHRWIKVNLHGSWFARPCDLTKIHLARLQAMCSFCAHSGLDQSASYEEVLTATVWMWREDQWEKRLLVWKNNAPKEVSVYAAIAKRRHLLHWKKSKDEQEHNHTCTLCTCVNTRSLTWSGGNVWEVPKDSVHTRKNPGAESRPPSVEQSAPEGHETTVMQNCCWTKNTLYTLTNSVRNQYGSKWLLYCQVSNLIVQRAHMWKWI